MKITIPKGFFENKTDVTLDEFLEMFKEFIKIASALEENLKDEQASLFRFIHENADLKKRIKELEAELEGVRA